MKTTYIQHCGNQVIGDIGQKRVGGEWFSLNLVGSPRNCKKILENVSQTEVETVGRRGGLNRCYCTFKISHILVTQVCQFWLKSTQEPWRA